MQWLKVGINTDNYAKREWESQTKLNRVTTRQQSSLGLVTKAYPEQRVETLNWGSLYILIL